MKEKEKDKEIDEEKEKDKEADKEPPKDESSSKEQENVPSASETEPTPTAENSENKSAEATKEIDADRPSLSGKLNYNINES